MSPKRRNNNGGRYCAVLNCESRDSKLKIWKASECNIHRDSQGLALVNNDCPCLVPYSFHNFPRGDEERLNWTRALQRKEYTPGIKATICSLHFVEGRPTKNFPYPSQHLGHEYKFSPGRRILKRRLALTKSQIVSEPDESCGSRFKIGRDYSFNRRKKESSGDVTYTNPISELPSNLNSSIDLGTSFISTNGVSTDLNSSTAAGTSFTSTTSLLNSLNSSNEVENSFNTSSDRGKSLGEEIINSETALKDNFLCQCKKKGKSVTMGTQWEDPSLLDHHYPKIAPSKHKIQKYSASTQIDKHDYEDRLTSSDCKFFTGLDLIKFTLLVNVLTSLNLKPPSTLNITDQVLLVLMKLRLNLLFQDLGRRFHISGSLAGRIFKFWINVMYEHITDIVCWLPRETIRSTLPPAFKKNYPRTTCIIDCTEVFVQRPRKLRARALTYSNYKSHNTLKFTTVIAPSGYIMHLSRCYGGRASDNFITRDSGLFSLLRPGDEVMADRGFTISDDLDFINVKLNIPAFTHKKQHLEEGEVTRTRRIATVRIEVERVIGKLKCFNILKAVLPLHFYKKVDKIILICAALCNLQPSISKKPETID